MALTNTYAREKFKRAKRLIMASSEAHSFADVVLKEQDCFEGLHVLFASDMAGTPIQEQHSQHRHWVSIFSKKYLLAWSDDIQAVYENGETPGIVIGSQALFDTNLWSDLPYILFGKEIDKRRRAENTLKEIETDFQKDAIDWNFCVLENMQQAIKPNNLHLIRKPAASRYFSEHGLTQPSTLQFEKKVSTFLEGVFCVFLLEEGLS